MVQNRQDMSESRDSQGLEIRLFGPLQIVRGGQCLAAPSSRKTRAILGYLALSPRPVSRLRLCELFFDVPDDPRAALRWSLTKLRALVDEPGHVRIVGERGALRFEAHGANVDVIEILSLAARPPEVLTETECKSALEMMTGDLLEDAELPDRPEYAAWLAAQRHDFRAIALRLAQRQAAASQGAEKIAYLRRILALDPLEESATASLARALVESGRKDEAHQLVAQAERQFRLAGLQASPAIRLALRAAPVLPGGAGESPAPPAPRGAPSDDGRISVAVIPFLNHSQDVITGEMMDGVLEAVVHMLSKFREIRVAGLSASLVFKGALRDPAAMAATLGVSHLIGGSVMAREGKLKVRYRLVAGHDGSMITSGDVDHPAADAPALLEDAPARLVVLLAHHLADVARQQALAKRAEDRNASDHFMAGLHFGFFSMPIDYSAALNAFESGLRTAPDDPCLNAYAAWAKAGLGHAQREPERAAAIAQAHRAIVAADNNAEALAIAAWSLVHLGQEFDNALRAVELATRLNPLSRIVWSASAWIGAMAGEFERPISHWNNAERCNPLGSNIDTTESGRALCYWMTGKFVEAAAAAKRAIDRQPSHPGGHMAAVASAVEQGQAERIKTAVAAMLRYFPDAPDTPVMASIPIRDSDTKQRLLQAIRTARADHERLARETR